MGITMCLIYDLAQPTTEISFITCFKAPETIREITLEIPLDESADNNKKYSDT